MRKAAAMFALALAFAAFSPAAHGGMERLERKAIYMTLAGPLEIVRAGGEYGVLLNGRSILESKNGALTVQTSMSVGDAVTGYDIMLLRRGVGDPACPVTYDLITVGGDGTYAVALGFNNCSRLLDVRMGTNELYFVLERPDGKQEIMAYDDAARTKAVKNAPVVRLRKSIPGSLPEK